MKQQNLRKRTSNIDFRTINEEDISLEIIKETCNELSTNNIITLISGINKGHANVDENISLFMENYAHHFKKNLNSNTN